MAAQANAHPIFQGLLASLPQALTAQVRLVQGFRAQFGRHRTYPTAAMARDYDRGWCELDDSKIVALTPAHDGWLDREADVQARDDERREAAEEAQ